VESELEIQDSAHLRFFSGMIKVSNTEITDVANLLATIINLFINYWPIA